MVLRFQISDFSKDFKISVKISKDFNQKRTRFQGVSSPSHWTSGGDNRDATGCTGHLEVIGEIQLVALDIWK